MEKRLTTIVYIDNNNYINYLEKLLELDRHIQFIIVTNKKLELDNIQNNFELICEYDYNLNDLYNIALQKATSKYIHFIDSNTYIKNSYYKSIITKLTEETVYNIIPVFNDNSNKKKTFPFYMNNSIKSIELNEEISLDNIILSSYIFYRKKVEKIFFNDKYCYESLTAYILDAVNKFQSINFLSYKYYYSKAIEINFNDYEYSHYSWWYNDSLEQFILPYLKKYNNYYSKRKLLYILMIKYASNMNSRNKNIIVDDQVKEFIKLTKLCLNEISNELLSGFSNEKISNYIKSIFYNLKYENIQNNFEIKNNKPYLTSNNINIRKIDDLDLEVVAINYSKNQLILDLKFNHKMIIDSGGKIECYLKSKEINVLSNNIYSEISFFNINMFSSYTFQIVIDKIENNEKINFFLSDEKRKIKLDLTFKEPSSRLNSNYSLGYWNFDKYILVYNKKEKTIIINKRKIYKTIKHEFLMFYQLIKQKRNTPLKIIQFQLLRMLYWIVKPFYRNRKIWITFDKLYKGGDNGEYFFKYINSLIDKEEEIYYVLNKDSSDYIRLTKEYKNVIAFNSLKHKLLTLYAEAIFTTHSGVNKFCGYGNLLMNYFSNLFNADVHCIQHGLTIQDIAIFQNRLKDNIKLYFLASNKEYDNLMKPEYGYTDDNLKIVGLARFDGLIDKNKKEILITPTWRKELAKENLKIGSTREYNPFFKDSEYFHLYEKLINDKRLLEKAEEKGYTILYLLHPVLSCQIEDFNDNGKVKIVAAAGDISYEKVLTESSLMITDYSGVQYDFAYMRKPVIYYHSNLLPPHYDTGAMDYEKDGFGPICDNHDSLINEICEFMNDEEKYKNKYKNRFNNFFKYDDYNNCKRIYEITKEYYKNGEK